jgi:hypothetical protein
MITPDHLTSYYCNCPNNKSKPLFEYSDDKKTLVIRCNHHKEHIKYKIQIIGDGHFILPDEQ